MVGRRRGGGEEVAETAAGRPLYRLSSRAVTPAIVSLP